MQTLAGRFGLINCLLASSSMQDGSARRTEKLTSSITPNELAGCPFCPPPIAPVLLAPTGRVLSSAANGSLEACVYALLARRRGCTAPQANTFDRRQVR